MMNKIREIRFGKKEKPDVIDPTAYSQDGYLIHQGRMKDVRYGRKTTKDTGCGWISCFNFLKFMDKPVPPLKVAYDMEGTLLWGGRIGSNPLAVWWYLWRKGFHFRVAFTRWGMERLVRHSVREHNGRVAGVLAYIHKKGSHYTTFIREAGEVADQSANGSAKSSINQPNDRSGIQLRFLNAVYGVENHRLTGKDFFEKYVKFPICFVIVAR